MRKSRPKKRLIVPDPRFNDTLVTKFVNNIMLSGKKNQSYDIFYEAIDIVTEKRRKTGLRCSRKPWLMLLLQLKSAAAVSGVPLSRSLQRSGLHAKVQSV